MKPKERMLRALARETPDRVPATAHQWQPFHLRRYLGGCSDLEAFRRFGLDASLARFPLLPLDDPNWRIETTPLPAPEGEERWRIGIATPLGSLEGEIGRNEITTWNIRHLVRHAEDLEIVDRYLPVPKLDQAAVRRERDLLGDDGILRGFVFGDQGGCWQHAACLVGTQELILQAADDPAWVHLLLGSLWKKKERFIEESLRGACFDLIETGGGAASSTVISPRYYEEFCLPYDRRMHDALRAAGHRSVYHTCGGMMPILELLCANGCDAIETLTPPSMGGDARPEELKRRTAGKVALIGGIDQSAVLERGSMGDIRRHVRFMFEAYGAGGGYLMSPSDHFFHVPPDNLRAFADAARECVYVQ